MRNPLILSTLALGLSLSALAAQGPIFRNSLPDGLLKQGGNYSSGNGVSYVFDRGTFHYQEVHQSWKGKGAKVLLGVGFRRGWNKATTSGAVARKFDFQFTIGVGNLITFSNASFAGNYKTTPTLAFPRKNLSLPSWVNRPATAPAPFDVYVPFSSIGLYTGTDDMVWELELTNPTVTGGGYYCDRQSGSSYSSASGQLVGTGCVATGQTSTHSLSMTLYNYSPSHPTYPMRVYLYASRNPANTAVTVAISLQNLNAQLPGWCTRVHPLPMVYIPMGTSSSTGSLGSHHLNVPYTASAIGYPIYAQAFAKDQNPAGISLSNARTAAMPGLPTLLTWKYTYQLGTSTTLNGPYTAGSVITGWM